MGGELATVTGATGFLGRHVVSRLLRDGYRVRCLVREGADLSGLPIHEVELVRGCLDRPVELGRLLKGSSLVVHTAAIHNRKLSARAQVFKVNVEGTRALIQAAGSLDAFVHVSSIRSLMSASTSAVDEDTPYDFERWDTPYGASKVEAERVCLEYWRSHKLPLYLLNPADLLGPEDTRPSHNGAMVLSHLRRRVDVVAEAVIPFVDVRDVADALPLVLKYGKQGERHILCAANLPMREFYRAIDRAAGQRKRYLALGYPLLSAAAWAFERIEALPIGFEPPLVRSSVKTMRLMARFSGERVRRLGFEYRKIEQTLADTVRWFLARQKQ